MSNNLTKATTLVIEREAITTNKIVDGSITSSKVASDSVNEDHFIPSAFTSDKIDASAIDGSKVAPLAVSTNKIANAAITKEKLTEDPFIQNGIIIWFKDFIPSGWALCDGTNGTPDLRDRFIVGAGSTYSPGDTGGTNTVETNTSGEHTHTASTSSAGSHSHSGATGFIALSGSQIATHRHWISKATNYGAGGSNVGAAFHSFNSIGANGAFHEEYAGQGYPAEANIGRSSLPYTAGWNPAPGGSAHSHSIASQGTHTHVVSFNSAGGHTHTSIDSRPKFFGVRFIMKL